MLIGVLLIAAGLAVLLAGILMKILRGEALRRPVRGGAVVMIGPVPIVLSTDPETAKILMVLGVALVAALILLFLTVRVW